MNENLTLNVNNTSTALTLGPLAASVTGDFQIVEDHCTGVTLVPYPTAGNTCQVIIAFSPTGAVGPKTGVLTVTGSGETATYDLAGNGITGILVQLTPAGTKLAPVDLGTVVEGANGTWTMFTIKNPAGAPKTNQFTWTINDDGQPSLPSTTTVKSNHFKIDGAQGTTTPCGQNGLKQLAAGESCNIWVQYNPTAQDPLVNADGTPATVLAEVCLNVNGVDYCGAGVAGGPSSIIIGTPASKLKITSSQPTKAAPDPKDPLNPLATVTAYNFGDAIAVGDLSSTVTFTVANTSTDPISVSQPAAGVSDPFSIVGGGTCAPVGDVFQLGAAPASCTLVLQMRGRSNVEPPYQEPAVPFTVHDANGASSATAQLTGKTVRPAGLRIVGLPFAPAAPGLTYAGFPPVPVDLGTIINPTVSQPVTLTFQNPGDVAALSLQFAWKIDGGDVNCTASTDGKTCDPFQVVTESGSCFGLSSLGAGQTCTVTIQSTPANSTTEGVKTLHFTLSASGGIQATTQFMLSTIIRRGDTTPSQSIYFDYHPTAAPTTTSYGFLPFVAKTTGKTAILAKSAQQIVLVENKASGTTLNTSAFPLSGTNAGDFLVVAAGNSPCGASLAFNSTCTIGVTFFPQTYSPTSVYKFATLTLGGNTLGLMGEVMSPATVTITPAELDFGQVVVNGVGSATLTASVTNTGETAATTLAFSTGNVEVFGAVGCGTSLAAGATCTLTVTAAPTAQGVQTGGLFATYVGGDSGGSNTSPSSPATTLTVTGVTAASLVLSADNSATGALRVLSGNTAKAYDFTTDEAATAQPQPAIVVGSSTQYEKLVRITNATTQTSGTLAIALAGGTDSFTLDFNPNGTTGDSCKNGDGTFISLGAGGTCVLGVVFQPAAVLASTAADDWSLAAPGDYTTTLSVTANPGATPAKTVAITGHGKSALDFYSEADVLQTKPINVSAKSYGTDILVVLNGLFPSTMPVSGPTSMLSLAGFPKSGTAPAGESPASFIITQNTCLMNQLDNSGAAGNGSCIISVQYIGGTTTTIKSATLKVSDRTTGDTNSILVQYDPANPVNPSPLP